MARTFHTLATRPPAWYDKTPEQQLERFKCLNTIRRWGFPDADFPSAPESFTPKTATEVLVLDVKLSGLWRVGGLQRTVDELWGLATGPDGYTKYRWPGLKSDAKNLRLAQGEWQPGIRWVAFDPNAYHKLSPEEALQRATAIGQTLAGTEVLSVALLFPKWIKSWNGTTSPFPNLSGLQLKYNEAWSYVPYIGQWDDVIGRRFWLNASEAAGGFDDWSSPDVRCLG